MPSYARPAFEWDGLYLREDALYLVWGASLVTLVPAGCTQFECDFLNLRDKNAPVTPTSKFLQDILSWLYGGNPISPVRKGSPPNQDPDSPYLPWRGKFLWLVAVRLFCRSVFKPKRGRKFVRIFSLRA